MTTGTLPEDLRPTPPDNGPERESLIGFLDFQRETVIWKSTGLSDADATRSLVPSPTTVSGLIQHLTDVERSWFRTDMEGEVGVAERRTTEDRDGAFRVAADVSLDDLIADYRAACDESRAVVARHELDDRCALHDHRYTLRWIMLHLIEETARHAGHIDILRELLDGATGE
ncbi:MAG: DinB family protein [Aeromicrobium sp.]|nr:DinB family protein [Aeromicrobium sp.]